MRINPLMMKLFAIIIVVMFFGMGMNYFDFISKDAGAASTPPPDDGIDGFQLIKGDWDVFGWENYTNEVIDLTGNLTIHNGGILNFKNVTLRMNVTKDSPIYYIEVKTGGKFYIHDLDGDPKTPDDSSNITDSLYDYDNKQSNNSDRRYVIRLRDGAYFEVKNSNISEAGTKFNGKVENYGIYANKANMKFLNSTITNCYHPFYFESKNYRSYFESSIIIDNSSISNAYAGGYFYQINNIKVISTKIYKTENYGFTFQRCNNTYIANSSLVDVSTFGNYGINTYDSDGVYVFDTVFENIYGYGFYSDYSFNTRIENCTFRDIQYSAIKNYGYWEEGVGNYIYKNNYFNNIKNSWEAGIYISNGWGYQIIGNEFVNLTGRVISSSNIYSSKIADNSFVNTKYNSYQPLIEVSWSSDVHIVNNTLNSTYNDGPGINLYGNENILVEDNLVTNLKQGILISECYEKTEINNNTFLGSGSSSAWEGIYISNSDNIIMRNNIVRDFNRGIYGYYATYYKPQNHIKVYGGEISGCTYSISLYEKSHFDMYNVSFNLSKMYFSNAVYKSTVSVYFKVDIYVHDTTGPVGGAPVEAKNETGTIISSDYTNETGWTNSLFVYNGTYKYNSVTYATAYNFSSNISGTVRFANKEYIVSGYMTADIYFGYDTPPGPPSNLRLVVNYTNIDLYWESYVNDLKSYKVFRNDSSGGWVEMDHITSPGSKVTKHWIDYGNSTDFVEYTYKIHHIDTEGHEGVNNETIIFNDWVVIDKKLIQDRNVTLNGSLHIFSGGDLELKNVNLLMNGTEGLMENELIDVKYGGRLRLTDIDNDNSTETDRTFIHASNSMGTYRFLVQPNGTLEIFNSKIQNASNVIDKSSGLTSSLFIADGNFEIYNSTVIGTTDYLIFIYEARAPIIYGTRFDNDGKSLYDNGIHITGADSVYIINCSFNQSNNNEIEIERSNTVSIYNNSFINSYRGVLVNEVDYIVVSRNYFYKPKNNGIYIYQSNFALVENNHIDWISSFSIMMDQMEYSIVRNNKVENGNYGGGIYVTNSDYLNIYGNTVSNLTSEYDSYGIIGVYFTYGSIAYNKVSNVGYMGIGIGVDYRLNEGDFMVYNNTIHNVSHIQGGALYLFRCNNLYIFNNTISGSGRAIYADSSDTMFIFNNSINDCVYGVYQYGGSEMIYSSIIEWNITYGYYFYWNARAIIINSTIIGLPPYSVYVNQSSEITLLNPNFNLTTLYVSDKLCRIYITYNFDLRVLDHFGKTQKNISVRLRNVYGTILGDYSTDSAGLVRNIFLTTRTQFYASNLTYSPHSFEAQLGNHQGTLQVSITSSATIQMQLGNQAPSAYNIVINPLTPRTNDNLLLDYLYTDPEYDPNSGTVINWYKNTIIQPSLKNLDVLPSSETSKGELWYAKVTPSDGADSGLTGTSLTVKIYNTKPSVANIKCNPPNPDSTNNLYIQYDFLDVDGDENLGTIYRWYKFDGLNYVLQETTNDPMLNHTKTTKGDFWKIGIIPKDGETSGDEVLIDQPIIIGNTPPSVENIEVTPEDPTSDKDISVTYDFLDVDGDSEEGTNYTWWYVPVGKTNFIEGKDEKDKPLTSKILKSKYLIKGQVWKCEITPKDGKNWGETVFSPDVVIENSAPVVTYIKVHPELPTTEYELWVDYKIYDRDSGDDHNDTSFEWLLWSGVTYEHTGLRFQRLPSVFTSKNERWACEIIPFDGYTYGNPVISEPVVIDNSPPSVSELSITPVDPKTSDTLQLNYLYYDQNNDPESSSLINWYKNSEHRPEFDNQTHISREYTEKGDRWYFSVVPSDGFLDGKKVNSPEIEILNSPPELRSPIITNLFPRGDEDLEINYTPYDPDGDPIVSKEILWYRDGQYQSDFDNLEQISASDTKKDQSWYYRMKISDGFDDSEYNKSFSVVIRNSKPIILSYYPAESEITIDENTTLTFGVQVKDMDEDLIIYDWSKENQETFETTSVSVDSFFEFATSFDDRGVYLINVTIQDWGLNSFKVYHEWKLTVLNNNRPSKIDEANPEESDLTITAENSRKFTIKESDEDTEDILEIKWYLDGVETSTTGNTYTFSPGKGEIGSHTVTVEINDGYDKTTRSWNVTVEPINSGDEGIFGHSWDEWSVYIQVIVILASAIVAMFGFYRLRKKKGALQNYLKRISAPMKNWEKDPVKSEEELVEIEKSIEADFNEGIIEDLHYFLLERQIKENLREIRQEQVDRSFSSLPEETMKELEKMLEDGKISDEEQATFLEVLAQTEGLSLAEKDQLKDQIERWRAMDKMKERTKSENELPKIIDKMN